MVEVPDGTYEVECTAIEDDEIDSIFSEEPAAIVRLYAQLVDHVNIDGGPIILDPIANRKLTPKAKLWGWVRAFGFDIAVGDEFDTELLVGCKALALIENKVNEAGGKWPKIVNFMPLPKTGRQHQAPLT